MLEMYLIITPSLCGLWKKNNWLFQCDSYQTSVFITTVQTRCKEKSCFLVISKKRSSHMITSNKWDFQIRAGALFCHSTKKCSVLIVVIEQILQRKNRFSLTAYPQTTCLSFDKSYLCLYFHLNKCGYFISSILWNSLKFWNTISVNNSAKRNLNYCRWILILL